MQFSSFSKSTSGLTITLYNETAITNISTIKYYSDNSAGTFSKKEIRWSFNNTYWSAWQTLSLDTVTKQIDLHGSYYLFLQIRYTLTSAASGTVTAFTLTYNEGTAQTIAPPIYDYSQTSIVTSVIDACTLNGYSGSWYLNRAHHTGTQPIGSIAGLQTIIDSLQVTKGYIDACLGPYATNASVNLAFYSNASLGLAGAADFTLYATNVSVGLAFLTNVSLGTLSQHVVAIDASLVRIDASLNDAFELNSYVNTSEYYDGSISVLATNVSVGLAFLTNASLGTLSQRVSYIDASVGRIDASTKFWKEYVDGSFGRIDASLSDTLDAFTIIYTKAEIDASFTTNVSVGLAFLTNVSLGTLSQHVIVIDASLIRLDASLNDAFELSDYVNTSEYYDGSLNIKVSKSGDTMTGPLIINASLGIGRVVEKDFVFDVSGNSRIDGSLYINGYRVNTSPWKEVIRLGVGALENVSSLLGGYATDIAIGNRALVSETEAGFNIAIGQAAMWNIKDNLGCIAIGDLTLGNNNQAKSKNWFNTAVGYSSFPSTDGGQNTGIGATILTYVYEASDNTAVGYNTLSATNWTVRRNRNTAIGTQALAGTNTSFDGNVALGYQAGYYETGSNKLYIANSNTITPLIYGDFAQKFITINSSLNVLRVSNLLSPKNPSDAVNKWYVDSSFATNVSVGRAFLTNVSLGHASKFISVLNTSVGNLNSSLGLYVAKTGDTMTGLLTINASLNVSDNISFGTLTPNNTLSNTFIGIGAGYSNNTGQYNTAVGKNALYNNSGSNSSRNTAIGYNALYTVKNNGNTAIGYYALYSASDAFYNVAVGENCLQNIGTGLRNTAIGTQALGGIISTEGNTAIGYYAGKYQGTEATDLSIASYSVFIGRESRALSNNNTNEIVIGYNAVGLGSNTIVLGNNSIIKTWLKGYIGIQQPNPSYYLDVSGNFHTTGSTTIDGSIILKNQKISGLATPINSSDAVNKWYVDTSISLAFASNVSLGTLSQLTYAHNASINWLDASVKVAFTKNNAQDASIVRLDASMSDVYEASLYFVLKSGDTLTGDLTINTSLNVTGNINGDVSSYYYLGRENIDGSWRWFIDASGNLKFEKRESSIWTFKGKFV